MLFVLSGQIQTGKTRWLQTTIARLEQGGVPCYGVIAPGLWRKHEHADGAMEFEKLGIQNELLPSHELILFAQRRDLANPSDYEHSQSGAARLDWSIDDLAITQVNSHFSTLSGKAARGEVPGLLVVDELGRLELVRREGLTEAVALLDEGPSDGLEHALIVVREGLLDLLEGKFARWGERRVVTPDEEAFCQVSACFGIESLLP